METHKNMMVAELQLVYKSKVKFSERPKIQSSKDIYLVAQNCWDYDVIDYQEEFKLMLLNRVNRVLGVVPISKGGRSSTVADPLIIFAYAINSFASSIVLLHNHPSGNLTPSQSDLSLTQKICGAAGFLDISVLDHLIISSEGYYSFADEGQM